MGTCTRLCGRGGSTVDFQALTGMAIEQFVLVLVRVSGITIAAPIFGTRYVPAPVKAALSLVLALVLFPVVPPAVVDAANTWAYALTAGAELAVGLVIGYAAMLVFMAIQLAGQLIDMELGFGITNVIDPQYGVQIPLAGNYLYLLAMLIFLLTNGHHFLLAVLVRSFETIPAGKIVLVGETTQALVRLFGQMFLAGVKISAPILGTLFLTSVALGILARTVPQMNVFVVGLPVKLVVGMAVLVVVIPLYVYSLGSLFDRMYEGLLYVLRAAGG